eukprot:1362738-Amorphochlora_amoeboformis.AAC.2
MFRMGIPGRGSGWGTLKSRKELNRKEMEYPKAEDYALDQGADEIHGPIEKIPQRSITKENI